MWFSFNLFPRDIIETVNISWYSCDRRPHRKTSKYDIFSPAVSCYTATRCQYPTDCLLRWILKWQNEWIFLTTWRPHRRREFNFEYNILHIFSRLLIIYWCLCGRIALILFCFSWGIMWIWLYENVQCTCWRMLFHSKLEYE